MDTKTCESLVSYSFILDCDYILSLCYETSQKKKKKITVSTGACHATLMPAAERYVTALSPRPCLYMKRVALLLSTNHVLQFLKRRMPQYIHNLKYSHIENCLSWCWKCSQHTTLGKNFMMLGPMHDHVLHSGAMLHFFFSSFNSAFICSVTFFFLSVFSPLTCSIILSATIQSLLPLIF